MSTINVPDMTNKIDSFVKATGDFKAAIWATVRFVGMCPLAQAHFDAAMAHLESARCSFEIAELSEARENGDRELGHGGLRR